MTDFCCSCLPWACPGLRVQSKSVHKAAVLSGCLMHLPAKEAIPSQSGALGMVLFPLFCARTKTTGIGKGLPGHGGAMHQLH